MIKKLTILAFFLGIACALWKIPLSPVIITKKSLNIIDLQVDKIYGFETLIGNSQSKAFSIFDSTNQNSWIMTDLCLNCASNQLKCSQANQCQLDSEIPIDNKLYCEGDRVLFQGYKTGQIPTTIGEYTFSFTPYAFPLQFTEASSETESLRQAVRVNFGIGFEDLYNFPANFKSTNFLQWVKVQTQRKIKQLGFSIFIDKENSHIMFGNPQLQFALQPLEFLPNTLIKVLPEQRIFKAQPWTLTIAKISISKAELVKNNLQGPVDLNSGDILNPFAVFDTTTNFIWAPKNFVDLLIKQLQVEKNLVCSNNEIGVYTCTCAINTHLETFPEIEIYFEGSQNKRIIKPQHYIEYIDQPRINNLNIKEEGYCQLLVRETSYSQRGKGIYYLGYPFLKSQYTYFDAENNKIGLAEAAKIVYDDIKIDQTHWQIITGAAIGLFLLTIILFISIFKSFKYQFTMQPTLPTLRKPTTLVKQTPVLHQQQFLTNSGIPSIPIMHRPIQVVSNGSPIKLSARQPIQIQPISQILKNPSPVKQYFQN